MIPFPITQIEEKIIKHCKKEPILKSVLRIKFAKDWNQIDNAISRLVCYGVLTMERVNNNSGNTFIGFDGREVIVKSDEDVKKERMAFVDRDYLYNLFGVELDQDTQKLIVDMAGKEIPRTVIAKQLGIKKLIVIQVIIANEKEVEMLRRVYARQNKANRQANESA